MQCIGALFDLVAIEDHSKEVPFQWKPERGEASYVTMWTVICKLREVFVPRSQLQSKLGILWAHNEGDHGCNGEHKEHRNGRAPLL